MKRRESQSTNQSEIKRALKPRLGLSYCLAIANMLLGLAGCSDRNENANIIQTQTRTKLTTSQPKAVETAVPLIKRYDVGDVTLKVNNINGLPFSYVKDGIEYMLEEALVKETQAKAMESRTPTILTIVPVNFSHDSPLYEMQSEQHPVLDELPADFIQSNEELSKLGINIIQGEDVNFYIRASAFEGGGPFAQLKGRKLTIVIVQGPFISQVFLDDARYDTVRENANPANDMDIEDFRLQLIAEYQTQLAQTLEKKSALQVSGKSESIVLVELDNEITTLQRKILIYQNKLYDPKDFFYQLHDTGDYGRFIYFLDETGKPIQDEPTIMYIAVGERVTSKPKTYFHIGFDHKGQLIAEGFNESSYWHGLSAVDAQPSAEFFRRIPDADRAKCDYALGVTTAGQVANHEITHFREIMDGMVPILATDGITVTGWEIKKNTAGEILPNVCEYDADAGAFKYLSDVSQHWILSGFKDNSAYYFAFKLHGVNKYILTQNKPAEKDEKVVSVNSNIVRINRLKLENYARQRQLISAKITANKKAQSTYRT